jgi:hypothetical protein
LRWLTVSLVDDGAEGVAEGVHVAAGAVVLHEQQEQQARPVGQE